MGAHLTSHREEILRIVKDAETPLSAGTIHDRVRDRINLATVYRALRYLEERNLLEGFTVLCRAHGTIRYFVEKKQRHHHYFLCEGCHGFTPFDACRLRNSIGEFENKTGNRVLEHTLYLSGLCSACREEETRRRAHHAAG